MLLAVVLGASSCGPKTEVEIYNFPAEYEASEMWSVKCGSDDVFVMPTEEPHLASFGCDGKVRLTVEYLAGDVERVDVRPIAKNYPYKVKGNRITIELEPYQKAVIEVNGDLVNPLFLFANPLECARPQKDDENVIYCEAGKVFHADSLMLKSNQHLYLEGGAVLKGYLLASHADNVKISGPGYVDARHKGLDNRALLFEYCNGVHFEDFMIINKNWWTCVLCVCNDVVMKNYKSIAPPSDNGNGHENDGIDILGGQNKLCPTLQGNLSIFKGADTDLRPLGIQHHRCRKSHPVAHTTKGLHHLFVILVLSVRKIEARNVETVLQHSLHHLLGLTSRANGANDLGFSHSILFSLRCGQTGTVFGEIKKFSLQFDPLVVK